MRVFSTESDRLWFPEGVLST